jgi:transcriptional regulator with PAS, ATPase and Fis domain
MNSLSSGGLWFLWEEDLTVLRVLIEALVPRSAEIVANFYQLYTVHFPEPRSLSESEFIATLGPYLMETTQALSSGNRDLWADLTHKFGESLAERGVPFVEVIPCLHLFWESVMDIFPQFAETTIPMRRAYSKLNHVQMILMADAYFKHWTARQGARIVSLEREAAEGISIRQRKAFHGLIGASESMHELYVRIEAASRTRGTILIHGESGTGKELIAHAIHECVGDIRAPFIAVNCAALPSHLIESELFGYKRGAFSGATADSVGLIGAAAGGTLFLDEITEMDTETQGKLLRVLQERTVRPVGSTSETAVDVRILASTNRDPVEAVASGKLRQDLYYRLQSVVLQVPPLRDRREDVPLLARHFVELFNNKGLNATKVGIKEPALEAMMEYSWPGNVRELSNIIEGAFVFGTSEWIRLADLEFRKSADRLSSRQEAEPLPPSLFTGKIEDMERDFVLRALQKTGGNKTRAASLLGISRKKLYGRMEHFGLLGSAPRRPHDRSS